MTASTILALLPERLRDDVARAAAAAATTPEAWVERAVARQLGDDVWRDLLAYGEARAGARLHGGGRRVRGRGVAPRHARGLRATVGRR